MLKSAVVEIHFMVYDKKLAERIRKILKKYRGVGEKEMFGGLAFMLKGNMFCGIIKNDLVVRVGKEMNDEALAKPHARPMDFTGKPISGYGFAIQSGLKTENSLEKWIKILTVFLWKM